MLTAFLGVLDTFLGVSTFLGVYTFWADFFTECTTLTFFSDCLGVFSIDFLGVSTFLGVTTFLAIFFSTLVADFYSFLGV